MTNFSIVLQYTRTAEREANLIRPMPVLLKTIEYLLELLSQPYDEKFLGIYNFLWDRMRAIRMDLRMQHLFNENAITMLEQMVCSRCSILFCLPYNSLAKLKYNIYIFLFWQN